MRVAIHQPNVAPWLGFFGKLQQADIWIVLDDVAFSKGGYTNRVPCGVEDWLTVPVRHELGTPINRVRTSDRGAVRKFTDKAWRLYSDLPEGPRVGVVLAAMERAHEETMGSLAHVNMASCGALFGLLGLRMRHAPVPASTLRKEAKPGEEGLLQLVLAVGGTTYISGGGGAMYHDPGPWERSGVTWKRSAWVHPVYDGMPCPGLTALDAVARDFFRSFPMEPKKLV